MSGVGWQLKDLSTLRQVDTLSHWCRKGICGGASLKLVNIVEVEGHSRRKFLFEKKIFH